MNICSSQFSPFFLCSTLLFACETSWTGLWIIFSFLPHVLSLCLSDLLSETFPQFHLPFFYKVFYFYFHIFNFQEIFFVLSSVFFFFNNILFLSHGCNVFSYLANVINASLGKFFSPCIISVSSKLLLFCTLIYLVEAFLKNIFIRGCQNSWSSLTVSLIVECHAVPVDGGSLVSVSSDSSTWAC